MLRHCRSTFGWIMAVIGCVLAGLLISAPAGAGEFPQKGKAIQIIVGYGAGGPTDMGARILAAELEKVLGTPVVVVNKPGANTQVSLSFLAQAKPDGYTFGSTSFPTTITGYLDPARKAVYNRKSFEPLAMQVNDANLFAVLATSPFKTLKDLVETAKANPKKITVSSGILNDEQFSILMFQKAAGVQFSQVTFAEGTAPAIIALLGGNIDVYCGHAPDVVAHVKSGGMRVLGIMDSEDNPSLPGVKTFEAQGYKLYSSSSRGYALPAGTPREVVNVLSDAMKKVIASEEHRKRITDLGLIIRYMDSAQLAKWWDEYERTVIELMKLAKEE